MKKVFVLISVVALLGLTACAGGDPVDNLINQYETIMKEAANYAKKAGAGEEVDLAAGMAFFGKIMGVMTELEKYEDKMTDVQKKRMEDIAVNLGTGILGN